MPSFNTPAIIDQDSLRLGFFPAEMMSRAPIVETNTASNGFIDMMVSICSVLSYQADVTQHGKMTVV